MCSKQIVTGFSVIQMFDMFRMFKWGKREQDHCVADNQEKMRSLKLKDIFAANISPPHFNRWLSHIPITLGTLELKTC